MPCSCHLPWVVATLAVLLAVAALVFPAKPMTSATQPHELPTTKKSVLVVDDRLATTQHDLAEAKRVLNDAQSALAERDREISAANDELRTLRQALAESRAKASEIPTKTP